MQHIIFILKTKNITLYNLGNIDIFKIIIRNVKIMTVKNNQNLLISIYYFLLNTFIQRSVFSLLLYLLLGNVNSAVAQDENKEALDSAIGLKIESLNNLKNNRFYLFKIKPSDKDLIEDSANLKIVKRLQNDSYIVFFDSIDFKPIDVKLKNIDINEVNNDWKKSLNITNNENEYLKGDYWLKILNKTDWGKLDKNDYRINTILYHQDFVKVSLQNVQLKHLLNKSFITYIEKASKKPKSEARVLDLNLNPNRINTIHAYYPEVNGLNEVVSIKESFYNINDIDIAGRYINSQRESEFSDTHALEMATIIAGNGNSFLTGLGVAPEVFHSSSSNEDVLPDPINYFDSKSIQTQNHSYGTEIESFYGIAASLYDQQLYENPQIIHVFSVGNSGLAASDHGKYEGLTGFSNITGNFKQAKNILTIGAVDTSMNTIEFNSNGPAFDGRIKPELVAYSMTGTSNSAALVSGASVLLQHAYRNIYQENLPSSLAKALLINSADEVGSLGPDHKTGFGSLNAFGALEQLNNEQFIQDELTGSNEKIVKIKAPDNVVNFKATLVWTDPPANANDEYALINDLNFEIQDGSGETQLPWILSIAANTNALNASATKGKDHLNNIEQIHIDRIGTDSIEFIVSSEFNLSSPQAFSIAYTWEIENDFMWTSPTFNDNIPYNGETASHIRWQCSYSSQKIGNLYYKLVSDDTWDLIEENIVLADENFRWEPEIVNDFAQLKMEIDNQNYLSDTFSISKPIRLNVGFNCSDSLSFYWDSVPEVDYYSLSHLNGSELEFLVNTQDTSITIHKSVLASSFLKVRAVKRGKPLIEGEIIDYNLQGSNCFLESYFVESVQGEGIYHDLKLSSVSGIEKVRIEKWIASDNKWKILTEFAVSNFDTEYLETDPDNGFNLSRVVIFFKNGESVVSETQSAYYVKSSDFIVYPNPLIEEEDLKVFAKTAFPNAIISFYNTQGQEVLSIPIPNVRNFIDIDFLSEGLYFYKILNETGIITSGKILLQD